MQTAKQNKSGNSGRQQRRVERACAPLSLEGRPRGSFLASSSLQTPAGAFSISWAVSAAQLSNGLSVSGAPKPCNAIVTSPGQGAGPS